MTMAQRLRNLLRPVFPGLFVLAKGLGLLYSPRSYLRASGYLRSVREHRPCRTDGTPLPWMNYAVVAFLEERLTRDISLFEFGSGSSTLFFAGRVGRVVSVECDQGWHDKLAGNLPANATLVLCHPFDEARYLQTPEAHGGAFDIVVIDAAAREACLGRCWRWLNPSGIVLLDDSSRPKYQAAINALVGQGFRRLDFSGLKPGGIRAYQSTIFYRDGNVLGI
jgi:hypothetical protein